MGKKILLDGCWLFKERGTDEWKSGKVPGCVQNDLLNLGEMPDPFYRLNEIHMMGIEKKEWIYQNEFYLTKEELNDSLTTKLVFEGIDNYSDVYMNGSYLGSTDNMFLEYGYDIGSIAVEGQNKIEVVFQSTTKVMDSIEAISPDKMEATVERKRSFVRKAQYSFGWDWGPRIIQTGLWKSVYIELIGKSRLFEPYIYTEKLEKESALLRVKAGIENFEPEKMTAEVIISLAGINKVAKTVPVEREKNKYGIDTTIEIQYPEVWYPNGLGCQPIYQVEIMLFLDGIPIDEVSVKTGIRMVKLLQENDSSGKLFIFEVNGSKVFIKGANWVPGENMLSNMSRDKYYDYVALAANANMNMLRVWGGGIYESDDFYEACDEMGIMVWQDFMYSCAQYPDHLEWFQNMAQIEAVSAVKRLRNHPSLVLWCGNNENNWGFVDWWKNGVPKYFGNYIYKEILPKVCEENDPSRPYWVSSPYGGQHPNSMNEGDRHSWDVWSDYKDYKAYASDTGRFISEFGMQSLPTWKTILSFTEMEDRRIFSAVMKSHNKNMEGTDKLLRYVISQVGIPKDFLSFAYLTQFIQAESVKFGVEHWRSRKFLTAGTMYWQLNDCWPVSSWSCIDYYKRKKALYHYTRSFYATILPLLKKVGNNVELLVVSDKLEALMAEIRISSYSLSGNKLAEYEFTAMLMPNDVTKIRSISLEELNIAYKPIVLPVDIFCSNEPRTCNECLMDTVIFVELREGSNVYRNHLVFDEFRNLMLHEPEISVKVCQNTIALISKVPMFGVFVETENDIDISDNCLVIEPGIEYILHCSGRTGEVQISSIYDFTADI